MRTTEIISARTLQIILVLSAFVVFSGCTSSRLTKRKRAGIRSVSISPNVSKPSKLEYFKDDLTPGSSSGLLGALMAIDDVMRKNKIDVGYMVTNEFRAQLATKRIFPFIVNFGGDAEFSFKIHSYGLRFRPSVQEEYLGAVLKVTVYLKKANGKLIWKSTAYCSPERTDAYLWRVYITEPKRLRMVFQQAARAVVSDLLKEIETD
ncbi:MAG: hypothetical protein ACE5NM_01605 [Sedimentisphaerales bacterium]